MKPACILLLLSLTVTAGEDAISLEPLDTYTTGIFDGGAAEIGAFDPTTRRLFVVNGEQQRIDVLNISNPGNITLSFSIDVTPYGKAANSVAFKNGILAAAVEADPKQNPGTVVFFDANGTYLNAVTVGALPDMVTFTPDGRKVLVANEGEPNDDVDNDPEGSVSIINVSGGVRNLGEGNVTHVGFTQFNDAKLPESVRVFTPGSTVAQDFEPEYIAVSADSTTAYVVLQENNSLVVIDLTDNTILSLVGLGFKDHSLAANALDVSNRDDAVNITTWPIYGMFQPDGIDAYTYNGATYLVTANEGDSRDYDGFSEENRVKDDDIVLDPTAFPNAATLKEDENLGRLNITNTLGDTDGDGDFDRLYAYGARSFSIWNAAGELVWDSGDALEQITAAALPTQFNSTNDENDSFDNRSDDKGPEPEGVELGVIGGRTYAFIGLERIGGVVVYDITVPTAPVFIQYINPRNFSGDAEAGTAGDLGPEGLTFISAADSPINQPLLAVMNEVSGSTTLYRINVPAVDPVIVSIATPGQSGVTLAGTPGHTYEIFITVNGETTIYQLTIDGDGVSTLDVVVPADAQIAVGLGGGAPPVVTATSVPTLGEYAMMVFLLSLMGAALMISRQRRLTA